MKQRDGFKQFERRIRGDDTILEEEGTGGWLYTEYDILYRLGTCQISWTDYLLRIGVVSNEERHDTYTERKRLGIPVGFNRALGGHQPMRIRLDYASQPQPRDQIGEQQGRDTVTFTNPQPVPTNHVFTIADRPFQHTATRNPDGSWYFSDLEADDA
jgi:hypothetical protein